MEQETHIGALISLLETDAARLVDVAKQANRLPGAPAARQYTDAEIQQLNSGVVRILLEALHGKSDEIRRMFLEIAIPSFVREGETVSSLVHWNASYLVLLGSELSSSVPRRHCAAVVEWFAALSGSYLADIACAAMEACASPKTR